MHHNPHIRVSAVVLTNDDGQVALVRKHHTRAFIFPGGKPERHEDGLAAAIREVHEELGIELTPEDLRHLGDFNTPAANEAQTELFSQVYAAQLDDGQQVRVQAEIAELIWADPAAVELPSGTRLAPLGSTILQGIAAGRLG